MDLTRQPPRRPSNTGIAGIVGLARTTDKARGHVAELLGEFKYGADSGLDVEVLGLIGVDFDTFADAAARLWDRELDAWVRQRMTCSAADIEAFNAEYLGREPQDDLHRRLLRERIDAYAPGRTDITTVIQSIELDDWGAFRDEDLTQRPPRTPFLRSVLGIAGAARMADKARGKRAGKLGDYKYGEDSYVDRTILAFLGIGADDFEEAAWQNPNDTELGEWVRQRWQPTPGAVAALNWKLTNHGEAEPEVAERFRARRDEICPDRPEVKTYFQLMDIDDQLSFGIVDLTRQAPRSPYDDRLGGVYGLARMVDKGRAHNAGCLGVYWFGEDSGFDRRLLELLGLSGDAFAAGLREHASDAAVLDWLGDRVADAEAVAASNRALLELAPSSDEGRSFLVSGVKALDPSRADIDGFMGLTQLDDEISFARLRAHA